LNIRLAPSVLAADFARLGEAVATAERGGADYIHIDVMDGHFVPNITVGPPVVEALRRVARVPLDVHLMIADPDRFVPTFARAGAAMLSVHPEATAHLHRTLSLIRECGAKAGVVLNPATPLSSIEEVVEELDFVLVMSVNPGFGGQAFISRSPSKVRATRSLLDRAGSSAPIEVDGGIDLSNVAEIVSAGAEIIVAGSAVFEAPEPERALRELRAAAMWAISHEATEVDRAR
jgi:ribulose-phosphate 3-epimerase